MVSSMRGRRFVVAVLACTFALAPLRTATADDSLSGLREVVRTPPVEAPAPPPSAPPPQRDEPKRRSYFCDDWDCCDCDDDSAEAYLLLALGVGIGVTSPFWAPPMLMGDDGAPCHFSNFPHAHRQGYLVPEWRECGPEGETLERNFWSTRTRFEAGTNFSDLDWLGANVLLENSARFGIESDFRWLDENLPLLPDDHVMLGDCNVFYRFAQCARAEMRTGIGFNYLTDSQDTNLGFNFTYAGEWYPTKPVIVSGELDLGWLGHATVTHVRVTTGVNLKHVEAFFGYDNYHIGDFEVEGLVAGLRVWY